jgi:sulfite reductase beta subunit-like hemoprotein
MDSFASVIEKYAPLRKGHITTRQNIQIHHVPLPDAAKQALSQAQGSLRNIRAVDIVSTGIRGENLDEYRAHVRVAFVVEGTDVS